MRADSTNPVNLTNTAANEFDPSWSPDGSKIAFESDVDGGDRTAQTFVMDADGANPRNLTNSTGSDGAPSWR
jgi:Tol biopolymer transport system component